MTKKTVLLGLILLLCGGLFLFNASVQADENDEAEMNCLVVSALILTYSPANATVHNFPGSCYNGECVGITDMIGYFSGWVTKSGCDSDMWRINIPSCGSIGSDNVSLKNCGGGC